MASRGQSTGSDHSRVWQAGHTRFLRSRPSLAMEETHGGEPSRVSIDSRSTHIDSSSAPPERRWQSVQWQA
jgi:hypothetical protein